jgi:hypothetical protein
MLACTHTHTHTQLPTYKYEYMGPELYISFIYCMQVPMSANVEKFLGKPKLDESGIMIENALDARGTYRIPTKEVCFCTNACMRV